MTLQLELNPELEARLAREARQYGITLEAYALKLLEVALPLNVFVPRTGHLTAQDIEEMTRELSKGSENLPILPPEATERESFYEDRW